MQQAPDIKTFGEVCDTNIAAAADDVIKCIYLRRKLEIMGATGDAPYDVLSSLLHLRPVPTDRDEVELEAAEVASAQVEIEKYLPSFDYQAIVTDLRDLETLKVKFAATSVGYEKVQIFRMLSELQKPADDDTFSKFVNEAFHIENEYVMQLDPREFDSVPEFVVKECERHVALMTS